MSSGKGKDELTTQRFNIEEILGPNPPPETTEQSKDPDPSEPPPGEVEEGEDQEQDAS